MRKFNGWPVSQRERSYFKRISHPLLENKFAELMLSQPVMGLKICRKIYIYIYYICGRSEKGGCTKTVGKLTFLCQSEDESMIWKKAKKERLIKMKIKKTNENQRTNRSVDINETNS